MFTNELSREKVLADFCDVNPLGRFQATNGTWWNMALGSDAQRHTARQNPHHIQTQQTHRTSRAQTVHNIVKKKKK